MYHTHVVSTSPHSRSEALLRTKLHAELLFVHGILRSLNSSDLPVVILRWGQDRTKVHLTASYLSHISIGIVLLAVVTWGEMSVHISRDFSTSEEAAALKGPPDSFGVLEMTAPLALLLQLWQGEVGRKPSFLLSDLGQTA